LDPLAIVRQNFDAFQARDFDAVLECVHEDWRYVPGPHVSAPGVRYHGHEGYRSMLDAGRWREAEFEIDVEMFRINPYVLAVGTAVLEGPDGELTPTPTATLHLIHDGRIRASRGFPDVQEAMDATASIAVEEFRLGFDAAPDAMALLDDDGRFVHANHAAAYLLATSQRDLRGVEIADELATLAAHPQVAQVVADPKECSFQFNPTGTARFTSSCDIAKSFLSRGGIPYQTIEAPAGSVARCVR